MSATVENTYPEIRLGLGDLRGQAGLTDVEPMRREAEPAAIRDFDEILELT